MLPLYLLVSIYKDFNGTKLQVFSLISSNPCCVLMCVSFKTISLQLVPKLHRIWSIKYKWFMCSFFVHPASDLYFQDLLIIPSFWEITKEWDIITIISFFFWSFDNRTWQTSLEVITMLARQHWIDISPIFCFRFVLNI